MEFSYVTIENLYSVFRPTDGGPTPVLLLGAGASVKSGIPLSGAMVERAARWRFCRDHRRHPSDPRLTRSDWLPWLHEQQWYRRDRSPAENYGAAIWNLLQPREERKKFFLDVLKTEVPPSEGYHRLVDLLAERAITTVLTPNFDDILPGLCRANLRLHHVELIRTPADYIRLSTSPTRPQIIFVHGVVENYTDKNLVQEVQELDGDLVHELVPLLRDHPLVVIGYRGAEPSVMRHMLIDQAERASNFRHGIYWCVRKGSDSEALHPLLHDLQNAIGPNFMLVEIEGFDELMHGVPAPTHRTMAPSGSGADVTLVATVATYDMQPMTDAALEAVEWSTAQQKLILYCERTDIGVTRPISREWLLEEMRSLDLVSRTGEDDIPTVAGVLLFARKPQERVPHATVVFSMGGERRVFSGHLWTQLEMLVAALDEVNRPFRLKGSTSQDVTPYPPLAFKELVVNALVHRDYELPKPVHIEITPSFICITSPGGLVEDVAEKLRRNSTEIQKQIETGGRGLKGYRNKVLADLFYGAGAMDKRGSGLADVYRWAKENNCEIRIGPIEENHFFEATLFCRPEAIDEATGTATPLVITARYMSNLIEIIEMPEHVHFAGCTLRSKREIYAALGSKPLPPFVSHKDRLYSFADVTALDSPFIPILSSMDKGRQTVEEFCAQNDDERLVWLLHEIAYRHLENVGLIIDKRRKRGYFPRTESGAREITYQSLARRPTRTVTKPVVSRTTQRVRYWDHKAIRFGFERYADTWALQLVPTYVFTVDGTRQLVESSRVSRLATKRASRDYNMQVHNDLVFWAWVLSGGHATFAMDCGGGASLGMRASFAAAESRMLPVPEGGFALGESAADDSMEEEVAEAVEEALAEDENLPPAD